MRRDTAEVHPLTVQGELAVDDACQVEQVVHDAGELGGLALRPGRDREAFARLTGLRDVVGKRVTEVIPGIRELNPELFDIYGRVAAGLSPERLEWELSRACSPRRPWI